MTPGGIIRTPGVTGAQSSGVGQMAEPVDRFRSFAERYLVARAASFRVGNELQDAWNTVQDASKVYDMIEREGLVKREAELYDKEKVMQALQAAQQAPPTAVPNAVPINAKHLYGAAVQHPLAALSVPNDFPEALELLKSMQASGQTPPPGLLRKIFNMASGGK